LKCKRIFIVVVLFIVFSISLNSSVTVFAQTNNLPTIDGKAAITIDVATGEVIYAKNVDKQVYPASTTKIMTALLLAENMGKTDKLKYTQSAKDQPADSLNVNLHSIGIGETMSAGDVMDGLLMYSANDLAYMIADNISGDSTNFAKTMNDKAAKLNMTGTHFVTANGLHDPEHYTTPYDMSILARAAITNPWVKESMGKKQNNLSTSTGTIFDVKNTNKLLGVDGCIGGKTGFTTPAGRCLVAFYERDGRQIMGVVMNSIYDFYNDVYVFNDMKEIIDYSYKLEPEVLHESNSVIKTETLKYKPLGFFGPEKTVSVPLIAKEDVSYYSNEANKKDLKENIKVDSLSVSSFKDNASIGTLLLSEKGKVKTYKLYSTVTYASLVKSNMLTYLIAAIKVILGLAVVALIIRKINLNKRKKRRRRR